MLCISDFYERTSYHNNIIKLHKVLGEYLRLFKDSPPRITKCKLRKTRKDWSKTQTASTHAQEILAVVRWKCNNNNLAIVQIQQELFKTWQTEIIAYYRPKTTFTTMNTHVLQNLLKSPDHRWRDFVKKVHDYHVCAIFNSSRNIQSLRKICKARTHKQGKLNMIADNANNQYNQIKNKDFWFSCIEETEILATCMDKFVNNNDWIFALSKWNNQIANAWGWDKATKGGFNISGTLVAKKFSVKNSMSNVFVPGNLQFSLCTVCFVLCNL